jgi:hypothetical protein
MAKKPRLEIVKTTTSNHPSPPRKLGQCGTRLWNGVQAEYKIHDVGGIELLALACQSLDRAESLREQIDRDGELITTKHGLKDNPCLKHELSNRAFVARTLSRLGITEESLKPMGRPPNKVGWTPED